MKISICLILILSYFGGQAQLRLNLSVESPPFIESIYFGSADNAIEIYQYESRKDVVSPGIELDNIFAKEKNGAKLHYSIGFYYSNPAYIGTLVDSKKNQFVSEIKSQLINMPIFIRGSLKISELIDNNRMGVELGVLTTSWIQYDLSEIASVKTRDTNGDIVGETVYKDQGNLTTGLGDKINFQPVGGLFVYVNRFFLSARWYFLPLSDWYSNRLDTTWQVPSNYSFYQQGGKEGNMKHIWMSATISYRITRK